MSFFATSLPQADQTLINSTYPYTSLQVPSESPSRLPNMHFFQRIPAERNKIHSLSPHATSGVYRQFKTEKPNKRHHKLQRTVYKGDMGHEKYYGQPFINLRV